MDDYTPELRQHESGVIRVEHRELGTYFPTMTKSKSTFCDNETNTGRLFGYHSPGSFKDGINDYLVYGRHEALHHQPNGTRAAIDHDLHLEPGGSVTIRLRLSPDKLSKPFKPLIRHLTSESKKPMNSTPAFNRTSRKLTVAQSSVRHSPVCCGPNSSTIMM